MSWLGAVGALILLAISPVYLRRSLRGPTRPHPVSWGIWSALAVVGAIANHAAGGGGAVDVIFVMAAIDVAIFAAALRVADAKTSAREAWPVIPAAIGVAVWLGAQDPLAATIGVVTADACAYWPTLTKTWREPRSEPSLLWAIAGVAFVFACASVSTVDPASLLYPVYLTVSSLLIAAVSWTRRGRVVALLTPPQPR